MPELTLQWVEAGSPQSVSIRPNQPSKNAGTVRIGRNPQQCDIVLTESSVSGLHVEIFFDQVSQRFHLRSLREINPPMVNGQLIAKGSVPLGDINMVQLGRVQLKAVVSSPTEGISPSSTSPAVHQSPTLLEPSLPAQSPPPPAASPQVHTSPSSMPPPEPSPETAPTQAQVPPPAASYTTTPASPPPGSYPQPSPTPSPQPDQQFGMKYPLTLTFKFFALAPQIFVTDADGQCIFYVRQKLFKLKEQITVFSDESRLTPLYSIRADRIIDFSARYHFSDQNGREFGSVKRKGLKSLWKAHYNITSGQNETAVMSIHEENPWIKVVDSLFGEIPILGLFTGYFFNPTYLVSRPDQTTVMRLQKIPAFWSRLFTIKQVDSMSEHDQKLAVLSLLMMLLLERNRG